MHAMLLALFATAALAAETDSPLFNDGHVHLTNYVQEGVSADKFLEVMGEKVGRSVLFGLPLQQQWSYRVSGDNAPTYYLHTDAPLYYYSFTDAFIAMAYRSLSKEKQARFDPMITGFNVSDMYAADHIKRVLRTFPGVFSGIGEFTIHKEFVSAKIAGDCPGLTDPALDKILDLAGEVGLVALVHNDIDSPFPKKGEKPAYLSGMQDLVKRHRNVVIIWAHIGLGRVIRPVADQALIVEEMLEDRKYDNLCFDISWDEVAKYAMSSPDAVKRVAKVINKYPDRFLFGTDEVAPKDQEKYLKVYRLYEPLWQALTKEASLKVRKQNYERIFDAAKVRVRAWEKLNG